MNLKKLLVLLNKKSLNDPKFQSNKIVMQYENINKIEHFRNELIINGLELIVKLEEKYCHLLDVLYKLINYPLHERQSPFLGVLFKKNNVDFKNTLIKRFNIEDIELAYKFSGSYQSFVLYDENDFQGLIIFTEKMYHEKDFLEMLGNSDSILITSYNKVNKIYFSGYIFTNDGNSWVCRYPLEFYIEQIRKNLPTLNETIENIIKFSFYVLSPESIGATIVYWFSNTKKEHLKNINTFENESFNVNNENDINLLRNLLKETDGAIFIEKDGNLINFEIHLSYSSKSEKAVEQDILTGTRHSSAKRYSYDNKECVVITVSQSGPVTIFSNGEDIIKMDYVEIAEFVKIHKKITDFYNKHHKNSEL